MPSARHPLGPKRRLYAEHAIAEYWIADPEAETLLVLTLFGTRYDEGRTFGRGETLVSALLPGFAVPLERVFRVR